MEETKPTQNQLGQTTEGSAEAGVPVNPQKKKRGPQVSAVLMMLAANAVGLDFRGSITQTPEGKLKLEFGGLKLPLDEHGMPKIVLDESQCPPPLAENKESPEI